MWQHYVLNKDDLEKQSLESWSSLTAWRCCPVAAAESDMGFYFYQRFTNCGKINEGGFGYDSFEYGVFCDKVIYGHSD